MSGHGSPKQSSARLLAAVAVVVEFVAAAVIAVVAVLAVLAALRIIPSAGRELINATGHTAELEVMISDLLLAFIAIELMRIALAYIRRVNVLPTVIEAGLVAIVRQVVLFHPKESVLAQAAALATLALALGLVWYLLARSGAMTVRGVTEEFIEADRSEASAAQEPTLASGGPVQTGPAPAAADQPAD
ncbi:MAG TPA: phosphate-starvation-inducible PsiE family protein [Thermoleophilia bacterium]|nr:phosphate-starvation-inducible PsiE family protein [Thermoleophilia bacterium]